MAFTPSNSADIRPLTKALDTVSRQVSQVDRKLESIQGNIKLLSLQNQCKFRTDVFTSWLVTTLFCIQSREALKYIIRLELSSKKVSFSALIPTQMRLSGSSH
jgi:hypothetical protein